MPSSPSTRIRAELQAAGENLNTWGNPKLNSALQRLEEAKDGRYGFTLSGAVSLTSSNYVADQARMAFLDITGGTGGTITVPGVEKVYVIRNNSSGAVIITTGAGSTATIIAGDMAVIAGDGTNFYKSQANDFAGAVIHNIGTPVANTDACTKAYADALAMATFTGALPAMPGNANKFLTNNGSVASWAAVLPTQTSNANKFLTTDGTNASWAFAGLPWTACNSNITLVIATAYSVDTSAARALALPTSAGLAGSQAIRVADSKGLGQTNPITVTPNGSETMNGVASDTLVIDLNWGDVTFVPVTGGWVTVLR